MSEATKGEVRKAEDLHPAVESVLQKVGFYRADLRTTFPSSTLKIETETSTYWVTRTHRQRSVRRKDRPTLVRGVSVHTTSKANRWISSKAPDDTYVGAIVEVGKPFLLGRDGQKTGKVVAFSFTHS